MNPLRDGIASRYDREIPEPWPAPVPVEVTFPDVWEIALLTFSALVIVFLLPLALTVFAGAL